MSRYTPQQQADAIKELKETLPKGATVHTVLRHTSRTGMSRRIDLYRLIPLPQNKWRASSVPEAYPRKLTRLAAIALDYRVDPDGDGLIVGGCGMDMGFHLVYSLANVLYQDGYALSHTWL